MTEQVRVAWLAGINIALAVLAVAGVAAANWMDWYQDMSGVVMIGMLYGHVLFIGALWSMGPWPWTLRIPILAGTWLICFAVEIWISLMMSSAHSAPGPGVFVVLWASTAALVGLLHLPLGPRFRRWRLRIPSAEDGDYETRTTFSIRDLFVWTTIVALLLAGGRILVTVLPKAGGPGGGPDGIHLVVAYSQLTAATLLLTWPLFWALWSAGVWWKLPVSIGIAAAATGLECYSLMATTQSPDIWDLSWTVSKLNLVTYGLLALHAATARWLGYRLV